MATAPLLSLRISVDYPGKPNALREVCVEMQSGEVLGLIGHSGSGKSTLALAILRLLDFKSATARGSIMFDGQDLMQLREREMLRLRGRDIGLVLQSPMSSLNPAWRYSITATIAGSDAAAGKISALMRRPPSP